MDTYKQIASEAGLCLDTSVNVQPGLEVGASTIQQKWSSPREVPCFESGQKQSVLTERRKILGLSVDTFWALIVLLCVIVAAGIGGGVGAGLAKGNCKRYFLARSIVSNNI